MSRITLLEDMLLALVSIPLLDRDSTFETYLVINFSIPFSWVEQKLRMTDKYRIETEFIALNIARTKFMFVTKQKV